MFKIKIKKRYKRSHERYFQSTKARVCTEV